MHVSAPLAAVALAVTVVSSPTAPVPHARNLRVTGVPPYKYLYPVETSDETYVLAGAANLAATGGKPTQVYFDRNGTEYSSLQVLIKDPEVATAMYFADVPLLALGSGGEGTHSPIFVAAGAAMDGWKVSKKSLTPKIFEANQGLYRELSTCSCFCAFFGERGSDADSCSIYSLQRDSHDQRQETARPLHPQPWRGNFWCWWSAWMCARRGKGAVCLKADGEGY